MVPIRCLWVLTALVLIGTGCTRVYTPSGVPPQRPKTYLLEVTLPQGVRVPFRLQVSTDPGEIGQVPKAWLLNSYRKDTLRSVQGQGDTIRYFLSSATELRLRVTDKDVRGWWIHTNASQSPLRLAVHGSPTDLPILSPAAVLVGCGNLSYQQLTLVKESAADRLWGDSTQTYTVRFPPDTLAHRMFLSIRRASPQCLKVRGGIRMGGVDFDYMEGELYGKRLWISYLGAEDIVYLTGEYIDGTIRDGMAYTSGHNPLHWTAQRKP